MTGQLIGTVDGRPVELLACGREVQIAFPSVFAAWRARSGAMAFVTRLNPIIKHLQLNVTLRCGKHLTLPLAPRAHTALRLLSGTS
ncbi:hypothetical protein ACYFX5_21230 [Bremerella sp. T1]|uniref:hypothetical protein n=1 Tax=Bremerella sp. TYQ1 TaxID=3119568 RepID=UPI001CCFFB80|nr:hypothetical protein [Bremerella volcania]UBM35566.1 hypothetical protein LA756_23170 [Bremerella volcania]